MSVPRIPPSSTPPTDTARPGLRAKTVATQFSPEELQEVENAAERDEKSATLADAARIRGTGRRWRNWQVLRRKGRARPHPWNRALTLPRPNIIPSQYCVYQQVRYKNRTKYHIFQIFEKVVLRFATESFARAHFSDNFHF
jgi:hypothetical protein